MTIRVIELFAGIGAQASALERLGLDHERVAVAEFDEPTYRMYCAIHGDTPNLGDITKIEHLPECDLLTYSSPCQDISIAGHKAGLAKGSGTRSATLWDVGRLLEDMRERDILPEVLLMENVDSILFKHAIEDFTQWVRFLDGLGYTNSYSVLNAKDHGVPQNRKRMFMVSTLHLGKFVFPGKRPLEKRLKDVLETDVPEKYYLSQERIARYERLRISQEGNVKTAGFLGKKTQHYTVYSKEGIAPTQAACDYKDPTKIEEPGLIQTGQLKDHDYEKMGRVYSAEGVSPTIETPSGGGKMPKIEVVGDLHLEEIAEGGKRNNHANDVIGTDGLSTCLTAAMGSGGGHVPKIEVVGNLHNNSPQNDAVYGINGLAPAPMASAGEKANYVRIEVSDELKIAGHLTDTPYEMAQRVYSSNGVAPTIRAVDRGGDSLNSTIGGVRND